MTPCYEQHIEWVENRTESTGFNMFTTFVKHFHKKGGHYKLNKTTNQMGGMFKVQSFYISNDIKKAEIYLCAFCGAANYVPLYVFENSKNKDYFALHEITDEHIRCGMCAGDLKMALLQ